MDNNSYFKSDEYTSYKRVIKKILYFLIVFPFVIVSMFVFVDNIVGGNLLGGYCTPNVTLALATIGASAFLSTLMVIKAKNFGNILFGIFQATCDFLFSIAYTVGNRIISVIIVVVFTVVTSLIKYLKNKKRE